MSLFWKPPFWVAQALLAILGGSLVLSTAAADDAKLRQECATPLTGLATCLPYIGGTARVPTPDCCAGIKQLLNTNRKCLCFAVKDRNDPDLGLKINVTLALGLPQACSAPPVNISECPALLGLPPNSPEAQDFYQLAKNSSSGGGSIIPIEGGPATAPTTIPLPAGGGARSTSDAVMMNGMSFPFLPVFFCAVYGIFSQLIV